MTAINTPVTFTPLRARLRTFCQSICLTKSMESETGGNERNSEVDMSENSSWTQKIKAGVSRHCLSRQKRDQKSDDQRD